MALNEKTIFNHQFWQNMFTQYSILIFYLVSRIKPCSKDSTSHHIPTTYLSWTILIVLILDLLHLIFRIKFHLCILSSFSSTEVHFISIWLFHKLIFYLTWDSNLIVASKSTYVRYHCLNVLIKLKRKRVCYLILCDPYTIVLI